MKGTCKVRIPFLSSAVCMTVNFLNYWILVYVSTPSAYPSLFVLNNVCLTHNDAFLFSLPSFLPWFSWPISICLHQSYQLTQGLDSSMPATPGPISHHYLHLSFSLYLQYAWYSACLSYSSVCILGLSASTKITTVHEEREVSTVLSSNFMCHKY